MALAVFCSLKKSSGEAPKTQLCCLAPSHCCKVTFSNFSHFSLYSGRKKGGVFHNRQAGALATCLLIYIYIDIYPAIFWVPEPLIDKDLRV